MLPDWVTITKGVTTIDLGDGHVVTYDDAGARYDVNDHFRVSLTVNNLLDKMPPKDPTWANYPYYDTSWFDSFGRSFFVQLTYKFGGKPLD